MSHSSPTFVVVGAGIAGIAAAVRLHRLGAQVRVVDPQPAGGKAHTLVRGDWRIEVGPHSFTSRADAMFELAADLGIGDRIVKLGAAAGNRYIVRGGKLCKAGPMALSLGEMFGVVRGLFRSGPVPAGMSVREFLAERLGESFADGPGDAMLTGIWAASPAEVEMETAFPALTAGVREHGTIFAAVRSLPKGRPSGTYAFEAGMGAIGEAARAQLSSGAFVGSEATAVRRDRAGWVVETGEGALWADGVVVATHAPTASRLLADLAPDAADGLSGIRYSPLAVAHWISPDAAFPHGFGWLSPFREARPMLGTLFSSDIFPGRAPAGMRAFTSMFGGTRRPEDALLDPQAISERLRAEHRALTGRDVTIAGIEVMRHPRAVPIPEPGHAARVTAILGAMPDGLALAGAWCGCGAMNDAAAAGFVAATRLWQEHAHRREHVA